MEPPHSDARAGNATELGNLLPKWRKQVAMRGLRTEIADRVHDIAVIAVRDGCNMRQAIAAACCAWEGFDGYIAGNLSSTLEGRYEPDDELRMWMRSALNDVVCTLNVRLA